VRARRLRPTPTRTLQSLAARPATPPHAPAPGPKQASIGAEAPNSSPLPNLRPPRCISSTPSAACQPSPRVTARFNRATSATPPSPPPSAPDCTKLKGSSFHPASDSAQTPGLQAAQFQFVHLDLDLYRSTLAGLEFFYPRLLPGGVIVSHDYGDLTVPGVRQAFDDFLRDKPERVAPLWLTQGLLVKLGARPGHFSGPTMNPRLRVLVGGIAGTLIALFAGVGIANENYLLTVLVGAAVLGASPNGLAARIPTPGCLAAPSSVTSPATADSPSCNSRADSRSSPPRPSCSLRSPPCWCASPQNAHLPSAAIRSTTRCCYGPCWGPPGCRSISHATDSSPRADFAMVYYTAFFFLGQGLRATRSVRARAPMGAHGRLPRAAFSRDGLSVSARFFPHHPHFARRAVDLFKDDLLATLFAAASSGCGRAGNFTIAAAGSSRSPPASSWSARRPPLAPPWSPSPE